MMLVLLLLGLFMVVSAYALDFLRGKGKINCSGLLLIVELNIGLFLCAIYFPLANIEFWYVGTLIFIVIMASSLYNVFKVIK